MFILSNKSILDFSKNLLNLPVRIPIDDFLCFATYGCCHPCFIIEARRTIFSEYVYLYVNFILEISKHKFGGGSSTWQLPAANRRLAGKRQRVL